jgi:tRNA nucleotidyltransferase (CCA-adding enzyme)
MELPPLPAHVGFVLSVLLSAGHEAVLAGGCVRDLCLGRIPYDYDVATSARPEETAALFPRVVLDGAKHGTVRVLTQGGPVEVTTYRSDGNYSDSRHPESVQFLSSLEEDLSRRDFTVNAMALSLDGALTDPFHGRDDLQKNILRCVGDAESRFREDGLRLLRAIRFSAQLGFQFEEKTAAALIACAPLAATLSAERVRDEVEKILCSSRADLAGLLVSYGLLSSRLDAAPASVPDFSSLNRLPPEPMLRWASFVMLLHKSGAVSGVPAFLTRLRLNGNTVRACADALSIVKDGVPQDDVGWRLGLSRHGVPACRCAAAMAEASGSAAVFPAREAVLASGCCYSLSCLKLRGGDLLELGFSGPSVGQAMDRLLLHVIRHPEDNRRELLLALAQTIYHESSEVSKTEG